MEKDKPVSFQIWVKSKLGFQMAKTKIRHPVLLREPCRPSVNRKWSGTEMDKHKKPRCCTRCDGENHNISTCQGGAVGSNPKKKGARTECQVDGVSFVEKAEEICNIYFNCCYKEDVNIAFCSCSSKEE
ncbi:hypothetical protein C5167_013670 [Papaver somniferum]|uniref:Uncharacterized protein n=1 Tax=Papaver somniferum TaxID=3469 RepID=A0A4Y7J434_PAPSO|nr:hypothetical protein C5167_013670 [Papaver somniferum]